MQGALELGLYVAIALLALEGFVWWLRRARMPEKPRAFWPAILAQLGLLATASAVATAQYLTTYESGHLLGVLPWLRRGVAAGLFLALLAHNWWRRS